MVVIDCKISLDRPIPVEHLELDPQLHSKEDIAKFKERYYAEELIPLTDYLQAEGLEIRQYQWKETL